MKILWMLVVLCCGLVVALLSGCRTGLPLFGGAAQPSDQPAGMTVTPEMMHVYMSAIENGQENIPTIVKEMVNEGMSFVVKNEGYLYGPDGKPFLDPDGKPLRLEQTVIAKLNDLKNLMELTGLEELEVRVCGFPDASNLPENLRQVPMLPTIFYAKLKAGDTLKGTSHRAEEIAASAKEREVILTGLTAYAAQRGENVAKTIDALADGTVKVLTTTGKEIIGRVTGTYAVDAAVEGAGKVIGAVIKTDAGTENVICEGDDCNLIQ
jgi:hypothetical protein